MAGNYLTKPQQHLAELAEFVELLKAERIGSYLEIGCKFGGTLWAVTRIMPKGSRVVAVDLPNSHWGRSESGDSLVACIAHLRRESFDATVMLGDSTDPDVVERVRKLGPYDAIFIDANHTEPYVRKDFANYGRMSKLICFHDIGWNNPTPPGRLAIEVPKVWAELKATLAGEAIFAEIKRDTNHNGIGILRWR